MPEAAHELRNEIGALADTARQMRAASKRACFVLLAVGVGAMALSALHRA